MGERVSKGPTRVERRGDRELVVSRVYGAPPGLVFDAWSKAELFRLWWVPKSVGVQLLSCEMDVRTGGGYRLAFGQDEAHSRAFFGQYLEVIPAEKIVWTNEEGEGEGAVTTVTFEAVDGGTLLTLTERYPTKEELDQSYVGMEDGYPEQFDQLAELLTTLKTGG